MFLLNHTACNPHHTKISLKDGTRLHEISSCSCLTDLPGPAWVMLSKIYKLFSRSLYRESNLKYVSWVDKPACAIWAAISLNYWLAYKGGCSYFRLRARYKIKVLLHDPWLCVMVFGPTGRGKTHHKFQLLSSSRLQGPASAPRFISLYTAKRTGHHQNRFSRKYVHDL